MANNLIPNDKIKKKSISYIILNIAIKEIDIESE
jgi:hypothetical protein